jgi:hypothetical protein
MARFCTQCGTPAANEQVKFCAKCGAALPTPAAAPAEAPPPAPRAPAPPPAPPAASQAVQPVAAAPPAGAAKSSGPWVKIIVAVLGFFVLMGVLGIATCAYIGYRAKQKIEQAKAEYGLDKLASSGTNPGGASTANAREVCELLTKEEVGEITATTITEATGNTEKCTYASETNPTVAEVVVTWQGGTMAYKIQAGVSKFGASGAPVMERIPGIGDEAFTMTPLQGKDKESFEHDMKQDPSGMLKGMSNLIGQFPLTFHKGDVMVQVGVTESPDPGEAKKAMASKIASRL